MLFAAPLIAAAALGEPLPQASPLRLPAAVPGAAAKPLATGDAETPAGTLAIRLKWTADVSAELRTLARVVLATDESPQVIVANPTAEPDLFIASVVPGRKYKISARAFGYRSKREVTKSVRASARAEIALEMERATRTVVFEPKDFPLHTSVTLRRVRPDPDATEQALHSDVETRLMLPTGEYTISCPETKTEKRVSITDDPEVLSVPLRYGEFAVANVTFVLPPGPRFRFAVPGQEVTQVVNGKHLEGLPVGSYQLLMVDPPTGWTMVFELKPGNNTISFPQEQNNMGGVVFRPAAFDANVALVYPNLAQTLEVRLNVNGAVVMRFPYNTAATPRLLPEGSYTAVVARSDAGDDAPGGFIAAEFEVRKYQKQTVALVASARRGGFMLGSVRLKFESPRGSYELTPRYGQLALPAITHRFAGTSAIAGDRVLDLPVGDCTLEIVRTDSSLSAAGVRTALRLNVKVVPGAVIDLGVANRPFTRGSLAVEAVGMRGARYELRLISSGGRPAQTALAAEQTKESGVKWDDLEEGYYQLRCAYLGEEFPPKAIELAGGNETRESFDRSWVQGQVCLGIDDLGARTLVLQNVDTGARTTLKVELGIDGKPVYERSFFTPPKPAGNITFVSAPLDRGTYAVSCLEVRDLSGQFRVVPRTPQVGLMLTQAAHRRDRVQLEGAFGQFLAQKQSIPADSFSWLGFENQGVKGRLEISVGASDIEGRVYLAQPGSVGQDWRISGSRPVTTDLLPGHWQIRFEGMRTVAGRKIPVRADEVSEIKPDESSRLILNPRGIDRTLDGAARRHNVAVPLRDGLEIVFQPINDGDTPLWAGVDVISNDQFNSLGSGGRSRAAAGSRPVANLSWDEVQAFVRRLQNRPVTLGEEADPSFQMRLPTESEWNRIWKKHAAALDRPPLAEPSPVNANASDVLHVGGNMWELCLDPYTPTPIATPQAADLRLDETRVPRVILGGSYMTDFSRESSTSRVPLRTKIPQGNHMAANVGFRLVIGPPLGR